MWPKRFVQGYPIEELRWTELQHTESVTRTQNYKIFLAINVCQKMVSTTREMFFSDD
jgi:hypothetical protein